MKKAWKTITLMILIITITIGASGCMGITNIFNPNGYSSEEKMNLMKEHLKKKYGDFDYEIVGPLCPRNIDQNYDLMVGAIYDREGCKRSFKVKGEYNNKKEYEIKDQYYPLMISDEYEDMVRPIAEKYLGKVKVYFYDDQYLPNNIDKNVSLEDVLKMGKLRGTMLKIVVGSDEVEDFHASADAFMNEWKAKGWYYWCIDIYELKNEDFDPYTRDSFSKMIDDKLYINEINYTKGE